MKTEIFSWFCPLYNKNIAEGQCIEINYARIGYVIKDYLKEVTKATGKLEQEIFTVCLSCPNQPFKNGEPKIIRDRGRKNSI